MLTVNECFKLPTWSTCSIPKATFRVPSSSIMLKSLQTSTLYLTRASHFVVTKIFSEPNNCFWGVLGWVVHRWGRKKQESRVTSAYGSRILDLIWLLKATFWWRFYTAITNLHFDNVALLYGDRDWSRCSNKVVLELWAA